jgi:hypothetical protein
MTAHGAKRTFVESTAALSAGCGRLSDINLVAFRRLLGDAENAQILLHAFEKTFDCTSYEPNNACTFSAE